MKITSNDIKETKELATIMNKIDAIDMTTVTRRLDEISDRQPFLLSILLGYHDDLSSTELDELILIYFLIWEWFQDKSPVREEKITEQLFEQIQGKMIRMLQYGQDETEEERNRMYEQALQNIRSKALVAAVFFRFNHRPALKAMNEEIRGIVLLGVYSMIACFEVVTMKEVSGKAGHK